MRLRALRNALQLSVAVGDTVEEVWLEDGVVEEGLLVVDAAELDEDLAGVDEVELGYGALVEVAELDDD